MNLSTSAQLTALLSWLSLIRNFGGSLKPCLINTHIFYQKQEKMRIQPWPGFLIAMPEMMHLGAQGGLVS